MKKYFSILAILSLAIFSSAQTSEDAIRTSMDQPTGTARSIALGGAMGSLGGDLTSIAINPAGIAVYRSSEFTFTPSFRYNQTKADYYGLQNDDDKITLPFQQVGYVGTFKPLYESSTGPVSTHFSINYTRNNNYSTNTFIQGDNIQSSLLDMFTYNANIGLWDNLYERLVYDAFLLDANPFANEVADKFPNESDGYRYDYLNGFEYNRINIADNTGAPKFELAIPQWGPLNGINQTRLLSEKGYSGEFSMAAGVNYSNSLYLGASIGVPTFTYTKQMEHYEEIAGGRHNYANFPEGLEVEGYYEYRANESDYLYQEFDEDGFFGLDDYTFREKLESNGTGINIKAGAIFKPVDALRIGAAIHSPTFYNINSDYTTQIIANQFIIELSEDESTYLFGNLDPYNEKRYAESSYNFRTPFKAIASLSYVFTNKGLISADYEYTDYTNMQYRSKGSNKDEKEAVSYRNDVIKNTFRATHNLRFGAEFRPLETITFRGGYANTQSPYKSDHFKHKDSNQSYSLGLGYRMQNMFIDFAYSLRNQKYEYSMYYAPHIMDEAQETVSIEQNTHLFAVTLGWRF